MLKSLGSPGSAELLTKELHDLLNWVHRLWVVLSVIRLLVLVGTKGLPEDSGCLRVQDPSFDA